MLMPKESIFLAMIVTVQNKDKLVLSKKHSEVAFKGMEPPPFILSYLHKVLPQKIDVSIKISCEIHCWEL